LGIACLHSFKRLAWAARYNTWLLIKLTPKGVVFSFSFLFFSSRDWPCQLPSQSCPLQIIQDSRRPCGACSKGNCKIAAESVFNPKQRRSLQLVDARHLPQHQIRTGSYKPRSHHLAQGLSIPSALLCVHLCQS
jgi:hypothetical protein